MFNALVHALGASGGTLTEIPVTPEGILAALARDGVK